MSQIENVTYESSVNVRATILPFLKIQLQGPVQCGVEEMVVISKVRGFVSSELAGVPNTGYIGTKQAHPCFFHYACLQTGLFCPLGATDGCDSKFGSQTQLHQVIGHLFYGDAL